MAERKLTAMQTEYVLKFVACRIMNEAYRHAYNAENMNDRTVDKEVSRLHNLPHIQAAIKKYQDEVKEKHSVTIEWIADELIAVIKAAADKGDLTNQRQAAMDIAKLYGLIVDKVENKDVTINNDQKKIAKNYAERMRVVK